MCPFLKQLLWPKGLDWCESSLKVAKGWGRDWNLLYLDHWTASGKVVSIFPKEQEGTGARNNRLGQQTSQSDPETSHLWLTLKIGGKLGSATTFGSGQKEKSVFSYSSTHAFGKNHWDNPSLNVHASWGTSLNQSSLLLPTRLNVFSNLSLLWLLQGSWADAVEFQPCFRIF